MSYPFFYNQVGQMSAVGSIESPLIDISHEPLDRVIESDDSWLTKAVQRIQDEVSADPAAAVAAFQSSL